MAINLPRDIKKELYLHQKKWPELSRSQSDRGSSTGSGPAKWVTQDNLHITLVFLGYLSDLQVGEACLVLKEVLQKYNSFELKLSKITYGPVGKPQPRMVWVEGERNKQLSLIKKDLQVSLLEKINFAPEKKAFNPHITLARLNAFEWRAMELEERPEINENIELPFVVESIELMESQLKRGGPIYTAIESFSLNS